MAQYIKQANIFGRIGENLGRGLAEQLPEEVTRGRLAAGLKNLEQQRGLTPFQQFSQLASIPGVTPQMLQSGAELLRQQGMLQGARERPNPSQTQFDAIRNRPAIPLDQSRPGFVGIENTQSALQPAIPKTLGELQDRAVQLHQESPGLYPDYQSALAGAQLEDQQRIGQNTSQQAARQTQKGVETDIRKELRSLQSAANAGIPDNVYQKVEDKALDDIKNGKNELAAAKDARDELERISRDYSSIDALGNINTVLFNDPKKVRTAIRSLSKKFSENADSENFADRLVSRLGLSNEYAYYLAKEPRTQLEKKVRSLIDHKPESIPKLLAPLLEKNDSPLAISYLLSENGIDDISWRNYLLENKDKLNLSQSQIRELEKSNKFGQGHLNDAWLRTFGGP